MAKGRPGRNLRRDKRDAPIPLRRFVFDSPGRAGGISGHPDEAGLVEHEVIQSVGGIHRVRESRIDRDLPPGHLFR